MFDRIDYDRRHIKMNQRSTKIVQLLSREKDEITVAGFAEYFDVSQKTIRNDLKEINHILKTNKRQLLDIGSGGGQLAYLRISGKVCHYY